MSDDTKSILENKDVIAIDQDPLGVQGHRVKKDGGLEVWSKQLANGGRAVVLLNRGATPAQISFDWTDIGYPNTILATVRDLWSKQSFANQKGRYAAQVNGHAAVMVTVMP
jgi:alpha-galactosidase